MTTSTRTGADQRRPPSLSTTPPASRSHFLGGSLNHYHHHGMRFPRPRSVGKDSQGVTTGSNYTVVPPSPCLRSPPAPPHVLSNNAETHGGPPPSLLCTCTPAAV